MALEMAARSCQHSRYYYRWKPGCVARSEMVICEAELHPDAAHFVQAPAHDHLLFKGNPLRSLEGASQSPTAAVQAHPYLAPPISCGGRLFVGDRLAEGWTPEQISGWFICEDQSPSTTTSPSPSTPCSGPCAI